MKKKDLTNIKPEDLRKQIEKAVLDLRARRTKNTNIVKNLRKDLARVLTICNISKEK